ncbi:MAG: hypothetical protein S4CHLAM102_02480 [Chlamydiia bacterium]|nr:hypothetical protein [Chlamydiia bacterium]
MITPVPVLGYEQIPFDSDGRTFEVWYPVAPGTAGVKSTNIWDSFEIANKAKPIHQKGGLKVIVFTHGYGGSPNQLSWLTKRLVYANFMVIAIKHIDYKKDEANLNIWERARDITHMLDLLATQRLGKSANLKEVGIAGYSVGGTTAILLAGGRATELEHITPGPDDVKSTQFDQVKKLEPTMNKKKMAQNWRDKRVKALFVMAPAWGWLFSKRGIRDIQIPTYIVATNADQVLVTKNNAGFFAKYIRHSQYQLIPGQAGHYVFISDIAHKNHNQDLDFLTEDSSTIDRSWIQFQVADQATRFFQAEL